MDVRQTKTSGKGINVGKISDCCGASPAMLGDYDNDTESYGICPECHDHCSYIDPYEDEDEELQIFHKQQKDGTHV
jgi:hypothetical protein